MESHENPALRDGTERMARLAQAQNLWKQFDTPITDDEELEEPFLHFLIGTHRYEVWRWFEDHFHVSVHGDLMFPTPN